MKSILVIIIVSVVAAGCPHKNNGQSNQEMKMTTISMGVLHGAGQEGIVKSNLVIETADAWNELVAKLDIVNKVSAGFEELPIDFSKELVLACFDEVRNSGGFSVAMDSIKIENEQLKVFIKKKGPGPTDMVTMSLTQPYHIVKVPKTNKEIVFVE